jgi:hypothetical protein
VRHEPWKSGKLIKSTYNLHGWPQNYLYYWDKVLDSDPNALDPGNKYRVQKLGLAPRVTGALKKHLASKGFDISGLVDGEVMEHHHVNQGRTAVAIGKTNHSKIPTNKSGIKVSTRFGKYAKSIGYLSDIIGYFTGDPDNMLRIIEKNGFIQEGQLYTLEEDYALIDKITKNEDGSSLIKFTLYENKVFDKEKNKWVGSGEKGAFYQSEDSEGGGTISPEG